MNRSTGLIGGALILTPTVCHACSVCVFAFVDRVLPPILYWCLAASVWFIVAAQAAAMDGIAIGLPSPIASACIVVVVWVAAAAIVGPFAFVIPILWTAFSIRNAMGSRDSTNANKGAFPKVFLGIIGSILVLGASSIRTAHLRTNADFVIEWSGTGPALHMVRQMAERGPSGLEELRDVVRRGPASIAGAAAELLADHGDSTRDVPILINALERLTAGTTEKPFGIARFQDALHKLSGISLQSEATASDWAHAWASRKLDAPSGK